MKTQAQEFCQEYNALNNDTDRAIFAQFKCLAHSIEGELPLSFEFDDGSAFRFLAGDEGAAAELARPIDHSQRVNAVMSFAKANSFNVDVVLRKFNLSKKVHRALGNGLKKVGYYINNQFCFELTE